jgi:hypothetical protein
MILCHVEIFCFIVASLMFRYVQLATYAFFLPSPEEVTAQLFSFWRPPLPLTEIDGGWDMKVSIFIFILRFKSDSLDSVVSIEAMGFHPDGASVLYR